MGKCCGPGSDPGPFRFVPDFSGFLQQCQQQSLYSARNRRDDLFKGLKPILYGGREVWPLIEGGKGVSATNLQAPAPGRRPAASARSRGQCRQLRPRRPDHPSNLRGLTRRERHEELIKYAIDGAVAQVQRAYDMAGGKGAININVLWEMGGAQRVLHGVLESTKGLVTGVTCGAGMPYKLAEIAASYGVNYLPIISSARAFRALWKRAYHKAADWLAAVVYEDPWLAGGHNGLSNAEDPRKPQDPYPRVTGAARRRCARTALPTACRSSWPAASGASRMGSLDRQSRARPDRLPVRNAAAADPGKPDPARVEGAADDAGGRRRPAPPLLADRFLFLGRPQPVPARARSAQRAPDRLHQGAARRSPFRARRRRRKEARITGSPKATCSTRANGSARVSPKR